ncbi:MAG: hypothetical protein II847_09290 [Ruminobacter sp.]|uniref:hypothetical protein n=1 Tax=Ruminobacter sp. TaxID=2774296 RepID=UPI00257FD79F|nr:hypothetical protein [Ruminobacter sp.]MBQ3776298.1 hypothetical protein [Ruminobacter sp.]
MSGGFGRMVLVAAALVMLGGCHRDNSDQQMNLNGITVDDDIMSDRDNFVGLPNPFVQVDSLEDAEKAFGKKIPVLKFIPSMYNPTPDIFMMNETEMVQFIYSSLDSGERIVYRVSEKFSPELLNGDYNKYAINRTLMINGRSILVKGNGDGYKTAEWAQGTLNLCILSDTPLTEEELKNMIR